MIESEKRTLRESPHQIGIEILVEMYYKRQVEIGCDARFARGVRQRARAQE